jgi:hypothetical protein
MALGSVVGVVLLYHLGLYFYVDQKIDRIDALAVDGPEILAPALQAGDETYLVVGSGVPGQTGPASIVTLLASVSATGDRAVLGTRPSAAPRTAPFAARPRRPSPRPCSTAAPAAWSVPSSSSPGCASTTISVWT